MIIIMLMQHTTLLFLSFHRRKRTLHIIFSYYVHKIPNPFSLSRENVGRSRSSVTIGSLSITKDRLSRRTSLLHH